MPQKHLFEYAVIRVVPKVEREEFLNIGVIVYCSQEQFLKCRYSIDEARLKTFSAGLDMAELKEHLCAFEQVCAGNKASGPIGSLDIASRFRWLTATRSTILQPSKVHPGMTANAQATLERLFEQLVN